MPLSAPRERLPLITAVRSTLIISSIQAIRARSLFERYLTHLPARHHDEVRAVTGGVWLPVALGVAHYEACEALQLPRSEQLDIGREVGAKLQGTFLGTMTRMAKGAGVTPWLAFMQYQKVWDRLMVGGGVTVKKLGPKDASIEYVNIPFAHTSYFRNSVCGVNAAVCGLFSSSAQAEESPILCTGTSFGVRVSWA